MTAQFVSLPTPSFTLTDSNAGGATNTSLLGVLGAGAISGVLASGSSFGGASNADSIIQQNQQFDFYDGGGLDMTCLGMAECDVQGNVNTSKFGGRLNGCGGFINISQNARSVVFAGTFTNGGLDVVIEDGKVKIELAIAKGKKLYDKRQDLAKRDAERDMARVLRGAERGG